MYQGLPLVTSIESVDFDSSESTFETSVNSTMLVWASEISPSGSWISLYVPSTSDIISICNVVVEISEVLKYSFPSLKSCYRRKLKWRKTILKHFTNFNYCIAYRNDIVSRRNAWIHLGTRRDISEAQVNITEDNEDLNVNPESESELHGVQPTSWN